jgi:multiple antibiotic resistance protein
MTVGPLKIIGPFVKMTKGHDKAFKRQLAFRGIVIAAIAMAAAVTTGVKTLVGWGVSVGALLLAAAIVLFLVALQPVLEQYKPKEPEAELPVPDTPKAHSVASLALSPLAFPTILPPYGIAVLVLVVILRPGHLLEIIGVMAFILVLNLLAMLFADFILKSTLVATVLRILGAVTGVLQIALALQAAVDGLRLMGVV